MTLDKAPQLSSTVRLPWCVLASMLVQDCAIVQHEPSPQRGPLCLLTAAPTDSSAMRFYLIQQALSLSQSRCRSPVSTFTTVGAITGWTRRRLLLVAFPCRGSGQGGAFIDCALSLVRPDL